jgi:hypothetical protein
MADMDGLACPLLWPGAHCRSDEGIGFSVGLHLVLLRKNGQWCFVGGNTIPGLGCFWNVSCLSTCIIYYYIECVAFYHGILTLWGNCYGMYV